MLQKDKDRLKTRDLIDGQRQEKSKRDSYLAVTKQKNQPGLKRHKTVKISLDTRSHPKKVNKRARSKSTKSVRDRNPKKMGPQQYFETYKLRKIGDLRISGCMNDIEHAEIG